MILEEARSQHVDVIDISSSGTSPDSFSGIDSEKLSIDIQVEGSVHNIANFTTGLSRTFPTAIVTTLHMDRKSSSEITPSSTPTDTPTPTPTVTPTPTPEPTVTPTPSTEPPPSTTPPGFTPIVEPEKNFSAKISVVIYNCKGE
jgi:hypothetical protein